MAKDADKSNLAEVVANHAENKDLAWQDLVDTVFGLDGLIVQEYPTPEALAAYKRTEEYKQICVHIAEAIRARPSDKPTNGNVQVITLRLPAGFHAALKEQAHELRSSVQRLCFALLLQPIDPELVAQRD